mgnify:FL=1
MIQLKNLELRSPSMDAADINAEWKRLTFNHVNDIQVWKGYLNHLKSSFER